MIFNPTFFGLPKEASGIPKARNTWGEAWLQKRCSETEAGEQANRRTGGRCKDVPWCAMMCHVQSENEVAEPTAKPAAHSSRIFSDLLGLKIWQLGTGRGVTRRELNQFLFGQKTKITIGIFEIFIRYITDVILRYTIADDTLITLRKDLTSETDLHLKQLLTTQVKWDTHLMMTSDDEWLGRFHCAICNTSIMSSFLLPWKVRGRTPWRKWMESSGSTRWVLLVTWFLNVEGRHSRFLRFTEIHLVRPGSTCFNAPLFRCWHCWFAA